MVSESFARQYLPGLDPLTQRVKIVELLPDKIPPFGAPVEWQIVGVFHDVQYESHPTPPAPPKLTFPLTRAPWPYTTIGVRTNGNPTAVTSSIAAAIRSVNPDYPMTRVRTMDQVVSESLVTDRFTVLVFGSFAVLALLLAAIGIYGVMTFSVAQRNHELGIRMALGAGSSHVLKLVVGEGMRAALIGMAHRPSRCLPGRQNTEELTLQRRRIGRSSPHRCCRSFFSPRLSSPATSQLAAPLGSIP